MHGFAKLPYVTVPSRETKDSKRARQYITTTLAQKLRARKRRGVLFDLPDEYGMADMIRDDLAAARDAWPKGRKRNSDFLEPINDAGERLDFHSLRHTCGA